MFKYSLKRIALAILTLFIITIFSYLLIVTFISNPFEVALKTRAELKEPERKLLEALAKEFSEQNAFEKLGIYLSNLFKGDFGQMYFINNPEAKSIPELFFGPLKWSILVSLPSFIISATLGILLGVWAGYNRGKAADAIINAFVLVFIAIPSFIIAPFAINLFKMLGLPMRFIAPEEVGNNWWITFNSLLPAIIVISLSSLSGYTLYSRNQIVTVLSSNYVLIAKTKGLSTGQIFRKYVFRNISIPLAAILIPSYIGLLSGSIIVERFWFIPGTSNIIAQSFPNGEINVVMFNIIFFTSLALFTEILVDISYAWVDPRIKYQSSQGLNFYLLFKAYQHRKKEIKKLEMNNESKLKGVN